MVLPSTIGPATAAHTSHLHLHAWWPYPDIVRLWSYLFPTNRRISYPISIASLCVGVHGIDSVDLQRSPRLHSSLPSHLAKSYKRWCIVVHSRGVCHRKISVTVERVRVQERQNRSKRTTATRAECGGSVAAQKLNFTSRGVAKYRRAISDKRPCMAAAVSVLIHQKNKIFYINIQVKSYSQTT